MKISMPITKKRIENHFHYAWWIYALLIAVAIFGWNLTYTVTRYQAPPEKKVEWYFGGYQLDNGDAAMALMERAHQEVLPDMEEVSYQYLVMDDAYGAMQLSTWSFSCDGVLFSLLQVLYANLVGGCALLNLQPYVDSGELNLDGIDLTGCYVTEPETGEQWLCAVPMNALPGLSQYNLAGEDCYLCVLINGGNDDNTIKLLNWLVENNREAAPAP